MGGGAAPDAPGAGQDDFEQRLEDAGVERLPDGSVRLSGAAFPRKTVLLVLGLFVLTLALCFFLPELLDPRKRRDLLRAPVIPIAAFLVTTAVVAGVLLHSTRSAWVTLDAGRFSVTRSLALAPPRTRSFAWEEISRIDLMNWESPGVLTFRLELEDGAQVETSQAFFFMPAAAALLPRLVEMARAPSRARRLVEDALAHRAACLAGEAAAIAASTPPRAVRRRLVENSPARLVFSLPGSRHPALLLGVFSPVVLVLLLAYEAAYGQAEWIPAGLLERVTGGACLLCTILYFTSRERIEATPDGLRLRRGVLGLGRRILAGRPQRVDEEWERHPTRTGVVVASNRDAIDFGRALHNHEEARQWIIARLKALWGLRPRQDARPAGEDGERAPSGRTEGPGASQEADE